MDRARENVWTGPDPKPYCTIVDGFLGGEGGVLSDPVSPFGWGPRKEYYVPILGRKGSNGPKEGWDVTGELVNLLELVQG